MAVKCEEAMWLLSRKMDDKITEKDARILNEHLRSCGACQARFKWVVKGDRIATAALREIFSARALVQGAMEGLKQTLVLERRRLRVWNVIVLCLGLAGALYGAVSLILRSSADSQTATAKAASGSWVVLVVMMVIGIAVFLFGLFYRR